MTYRIWQRVVAVVAVALVLGIVAPGVCQVADPGEEDFAKGWDLLQKKQYQNARAALQEGLKRNPSNSLAHFYLGDVCRGLRDWACAEEHYEASLEVDDKSSVARMAKARLHKAKAWRLIQEAKSGIQDSQAKPDTVKEATEILERAKILGLDDEQLALYQQLREQSEKRASAAGSVSVGAAAQDEPMALVPAGAFTMGSEQGEPDERPVHQVFLEAYYMDVYEVTIGRYAKFLSATGMAPPRAWKEMNQPQNQQRPMVMVDWADAARYCRWAGKRLPTEAEWEKAARGTDARTYPWGNGSPTALHANFGKDAWEVYESLGYEGLMPVGILPDGQSPYGIHDLAGNVMEWVSDWDDENYYKTSPARDPRGPLTGDKKVLRGGAWSFGSAYLRAAKRGNYKPSDRFDNIGFRCAKTLSP